jgi:hypothetical protein
MKLFILDIPWQNLRCKTTVEFVEIIETQIALSIAEKSEKF